MKFMTKKLIDTNILIYAYDNSDPIKHEIAKKVLKELDENGEGLISAQNLAEFSRVLCEKAIPSISYNQVRIYVLQLKSLYQIIAYNEQEVVEALHLASNYGLHFFDSLLAATMESNFVNEIVTENERDFSKLHGLKVTNPFK